MEADSDGYLQYHTKITILGVSTRGYLCSGGTGIATGAVELEEAVHDEMPRVFERCVWTILPVDLWNAPTTPTSRDTFQHQKRVHGRLAGRFGAKSSAAARDETKYVRYGDPILLQHAKTGCHITVCANLPSEFASNCFAVEFVPGHQRSVADRCFRVLPKYKIRQEGERIRLKDQVLFRFAHSEWRHLNAIQESRSHNGRSHEVNCGPDQFAWRLQVYDDIATDPSDIRAGNPVLLYHKLMDGFFTAKPHHSDADSPVASDDSEDEASSSDDASECSAGDFLSTFEFGGARRPSVFPDSLKPASFRSLNSGALSARDTLSLPAPTTPTTPTKSTLVMDTLVVPTAHATPLHKSPRRHSSSLVKALSKRVSFIADRVLDTFHSISTNITPRPGLGSPDPAAKPPSRDLPPALDVRKPSVQSDLSSPGMTRTSTGMSRARTNSLVEALAQFVSEFRLPTCTGDGPSRVLLEKKAEHSLCPNSIWVLEGARVDCGGSVKFGVPYHLRHLATNAYLTVVDDDGDTPQLAVSTSPSCAVSRQTLFLLFPLDSDTIALTSTSPVRLKHQSTGLYVKRPQAAPRTAPGPAAPDAPLPLELCATTDDDDVFTIHVPKAPDLEAVHYVLRSIELLTVCVEDLQGRPTLKQLLAAQGALTSLILFCTESQDPDPMTRGGVPLVKHQMLLLDTNVQSLVVELLSAPFQEPGGHTLNDLESHAELARTCALGYRLLRQMVHGSPGFAFRLASYIPFMQSQIGHLHVGADTLSEMFHNNRQLLEQMPPRIATGFVRLCSQRARQAGYIKFLCGLCVCEGQGILANQTVICKRLLEENALLLLRLDLEGTTVIVTVPDDEERPQSARFLRHGSDLPRTPPKMPRKRKSICAMGVPAGRRVDLSQFYATAEPRLIQYFEQSLDLYAKLCVGGNMRTRDVVSQFVSPELLVAVLGLDTQHNDIPDRAKSLFWSIASMVYLDRPSYAPTVLGARILVKDCSQGTASKRVLPLGVSEPGHTDRKFLLEVRTAAKEYLRQNTEQHLQRSDRNTLTKQVIRVWHRIVQYGECTADELQDVMSVLLQLVDGASDVMQPETPLPRHFPAKEGPRYGTASRPYRAPAVDRYAATEQNRHIMECKVAACELFLLALDLLAEEKVDQVVDGLVAGEASDVEALASHALLSVRESMQLPVFLSLKEALLPILRDLLMYQHDGLVMVALTLLFRLNMMASQTSAMLQEVVLLQSPRMVEFYQQACLHAVRLQIFFDNKSNLRARWCELMLKELEWFLDQAPGRTESGPEAESPKSLRRQLTLQVGQYHFQRQCEALGTDEGFLMEMQDICRTLRLHSIVVNILTTVSQDPAVAFRMHATLYGFLRWFCTSNPRNQMALYTAGGLELLVGHFCQDVGAPEVLLAVLEGNYELCSSNNSQVIQDLIMLLSDNPKMTSRCAQCLQHLAVVNHIPVHRNQQQILRSLVSIRGDCFQGVQQLSALLEHERQWLQDIVGLVCACTVGHDAEAQALAQGLMPLLRVLKLLADVDGYFVLLEEQEALLRCLREVWWAWHGGNTVDDVQEMNWWNVTDSWWPIWWDVVRRLAKWMGGFVEAPAHEQTDRQLRFLLEAVAPCLTGFFDACGQTLLHALFDEDCVAVVRRVADGMVGIATKGPSGGRLSAPHVASVQAFLRCVRQVLDADVVPDCALQTMDEGEGPRSATAAPAPSRLLLALHLLQTQSAAQFPADTMDRTDDFDLTLLGVADDGAMNEMLLEKLMAQATDGALSLRVKVALIRLFTMCVNRHKKRDAGTAALQKAQNQMAAVGAANLVALMLQDPAAEVVSATIAFATSLFWGGNPVVQDALLKYLETDETQAFLHALSEKLQHSLASLRHWKSEVAFVTASVPHFDAQVNQDLLLAKTDVAESKEVLVFIQLLCEGHHLRLQNYLREQPGAPFRVNIVNDVVLLLKEVISGAMEGSIISIATQTFHTLTELCQGPCPENQVALVACNVTFDINEVLEGGFSDRDPMQVFELRCAATATLMSLLEGCRDPMRPELMARTLNFVAVQAILDSLWELVKVPVALGGYLVGEEQAVMRLAFNLFILMHHLRTFSDDPDLRNALERCAGAAYFRARVGVIEIARGDALEKVYFRIPKNCHYLTDDLKTQILYDIDRSSPIAKVTSFQAKAIEVGFEIDYHRHVTEWLDRTFLPRAINRWPRVAAQCRYLIHRRKAMREHLQTLIFCVAVAINAVATVLHNDLHYAFWEQKLLSALSWGLVLLTGLNFAGAVCVSHNRHQFRQHSWIVRSQAKDGMRLASYGRFLYTGLLALLALLGALVSPFWFAAHLLMIIDKSVMLHILIRSVFLNGWSLLLTGLLTIIIVYLFTVVGYVFFREDFVGSAGAPGVCGSLLQCFTVGLFSGVRAGGGLGDLLPQRANSVRVLFDFAFYLVIVVIVLNIVFGIIIDTFAQLRDQKHAIEEDTRQKCLVCGQDATLFDRLVERGFAGHVKGAHNMWHYLYFIVYLNQKPAEEYTGQESYVNSRLQLQDVSFFPLNKSMDLQGLDQGIPLPEAPQEPQRTLPLASPAAAEPHAFPNTAEPPLSPSESLSKARSLGSFENLRRNETDVFRLSTGRSPDLQCVSTRPEVSAETTDQIFARIDRLERLLELVLENQQRQREETLQREPRASPAPFPCDTHATFLEPQQRQQGARDDPAVTWERKGHQAPHLPQRTVSWEPVPQDGGPTSPADQQQRLAVHRNACPPDDAWPSPAYPDPSTAEDVLCLHIPHGPVPPEQRPVPPDPPAVQCSPQRRHSDGRGSLQSADSAGDLWTITRNSVTGLDSADSPGALVDLRALSDLSSGGGSVATEGARPEASGPPSPPPSAPASALPHAPAPACGRALPPPPAPAAAAGDGEGLPATGGPAHDTLASRVEGDQPPGPGPVVFTPPADAHAAPNSPRRDTQPPLAPAPSPEEEDGTPHPGALASPGPARSPSPGHVAVSPAPSLREAPAPLPPASGGCTPPHQAVPGQHNPLRRAPASPASETRASRRRSPPLVVPKPQSRTTSPAAGQRAQCRGPSPSQPPGRTTPLGRGAAPPPAAQGTPQGRGQTPARPPTPPHTPVRLPAPPAMAPPPISAGTPPASPVPPQRTAPGRRVSDAAPSGLAEPPLQRGGSPPVFPLRSQAFSPVPPTVPSQQQSPPTRVAVYGAATAPAAKSLKPWPYGTSNGPVLRHRRKAGD